MISERIEFKARVRDVKHGKVISCALCGHELKIDAFASDQDIRQTLSRANRVRREATVQLRAAEHQPSRTRAATEFWADEV